eukprot:2783776-Prorocentrum_lima.AAC.1
MTSSLVGSEMCIRDRETLEREREREREAGRLQLQMGGFDPASGDAGYNDCLLYTSDAADDM